MNPYSKSYYQNNHQDADRLALGMYYRIFKIYAKPNSKILEFGAGNGFLSRRLAKIYKSYAIELSDFAKKNISINSPKTKIINNIDMDKFDGIISLHTLEHIKQPEIIVKNFYKNLKTKGVVLIVVPDFEGYGHRIKKEKWFGFKDKTHVSLLTGQQWIKIFTDSGFEIIKTGSDWFWDTPYLPLIPNLIQKILFYPGCMAMVLLGRIIYPSKWGEDLVLVARKN